MLKVELHTHTADDPVDRIPFTTLQLIDRAVALGFDALAITLHDRQLDLGPFQPYAKERGIVLIPGIERTIRGKHVLLLNFRHGTENIHSFDDLSTLKRRERGLVVAPHPFFPATSCLHSLLDRHEELFDAVEHNAMFTAWVDFNKAAVRWANARGKPMVGNGDVHRLVQLGTTYSMVDAERDPDSICAAIAEGKVTVHARPHSWLAAGRLGADLLVTTLLHKAWPPMPSVDAAVRRSG